MTTTVRSPKPLIADPLFWAKVVKTRGCWEYAGARSQGYGFLKRRKRVKGMHVSAHIYSYEMHYGEIPEGLFVCHRCDNRPCIRPAHLFLGTPDDNQQDMIRKGRARKAKGAAHYRSVLNVTKVRRIRRLAAAGASSVQLAPRFSVSRQAIRDVIALRTWANLT